MFLYLNYSLIEKLRKQFGGIEVRKENKSKEKLENIFQLRLSLTLI